MKVPVVSGLVARLKDVLRPEDETAGSSGTPTPRDILENDDLTLSYASLLADKESKSYGTVQLVTLTQFRQELGPIWDQYEKNILLIAETTIDRMLSKAQTAIREDEETWLLITPDLTPEDAERFAERIAAAIGEKLVGARFEATDVPDGDATPLTGTLDITTAMTPEGRLDRSMINRAIANAQAVLVARAQAKRAEAEMSERGDEKEKRSKASAASNETEFVTAEEGLKLRYWPAWSADAQSIDTFFCRPVGAAPGDPLSREDPRQTAANAVAVARGCAVALNGMVNDSVRAKLVTPIPYLALMSSAQRAILQAFQKLHESHRFLYLRLEITHVPAVVTLPTLLTARDLLLPIARDIGILTDLATPNRVVLSASRVMIGADASSTSGDRMTALEQFRAACQGRPCYVVGLETGQELKTAVYADYNEIGGPVVQDVLKRRPEKTTPMLRDSLLSIAG